MPMIARYRISSNSARGKEKEYLSADHHALQDCKSPYTVWVILAGVDLK